MRPVPLQAADLTFNSVRKRQSQAELHWWNFRIVYTWPNCQVNSV